MTLKNLLGFAVVAALTVSSAMAQTTTTNTSGPRLMVDLLRNGDGIAIVDPATGGLTYVVSVLPDVNAGTFTGASAGPNGSGGSVALEFGVVLPSGLSDNTPDAASPTGDQAAALTIDSGAVVVNTNSTPGVGTTSDDNGDTGIVDFANPGNSIFGFEPLVFDSDDADTDPNFVGGVAVGTVTGGAFDGQDAVFASLGSTFITSGDAAGGAAFEILRIQTSRLASDSDNGSLTHSAILTGVGDLVAAAAGGTAAVGSVVAAQSTDLDPNDGTPDPASQNFFPESITDSDTIIGGDADLDGDVDFTDFLALSPNFNNPGDFIWTQGDFDGDGDVDFSDFLVLSPNFNNFGGNPNPVVSGGVVPEPSTALLFMISLAAAGLGRSRN